jgi:PTH1 family peptidyl-tRNA hydrolase
LLKWMKSLLSFRNAATKDYIIVGLGNPGKTYEKTRHNAGFRAVRCFAKRHSITLKHASKIFAEVGTGHVGASIVRVVLPLTYMNKSGEAVAMAMKAFKVPADRIAVVVDDIAFPVGDMRLKEKGSHGGHNGLRSIEQCLGNSDFIRLRIGVGHPSLGSGDLAEFVLSSFDKEDEKKLPEVFNHAVDVLDCWIAQGIQAAMTFANTKRVN